MAFVLEDFIRETTETTGTDDLVLVGAVSQFNPFSSALSDGDTTIYGLIASDGSKEAGLGTYVAASNTLQRTIVKSSTDGAANKLNLPSGTHIVFIGPDAGGMELAYSALQSSDIGSSVQAYDADTAKLDVANEWTAAQEFTAGVTGGVATVTLSSDAATIPLDGRCHVLDLDSASGAVTLSFSTPSGANWASTLVHIIQSSTARTVTWSSTTSQTSQELPTADNARSSWIVWTPDGGTTYLLSGAGV